MKIPFPAEWREQKGMFVIRHCGGLLGSADDDTGACLAWSTQSAAEKALAAYKAKGVVTDPAAKVDCIGLVAK